MRRTALIISSVLLLNACTNHFERTGTGVAVGAAAGGMAGAMCCGDPINDAGAGIIVGAIVGGIIGYLLDVSYADRY